MPRYHEVVEARFVTADSPKLIYSGLGTLYGVLYSASSNGSLSAWASSTANALPINSRKIRLAALAHTTVSWLASTPLNFSDGLCVSLSDGGCASFLWRQRL